MRNDGTSYANWLLPSPHHHHHLESISLGRVLLFSFISSEHERCKFIKIAWLVNGQKMKVLCGMLVHLIIKGSRCYCALSRHNNSNLGMPWNHLKIWRNSPPHIYTMNITWIYRLDSYQLLYTFVNIFWDYIILISWFGITRSLQKWLALFIS